MKKSTDTKIARYIFDGWDHPILREKYMGDLSYWETEIRSEADCPEILRWIHEISFPANPNDKDEVFDGFEGRILEVCFHKDNISPEDIEKFFDEYKIRVHRAEPFLVNAENTYDITPHEAQKFIGITKNFIKELKKRYTNSDQDNADNSDDKKDS